MELRFIGAQELPREVLLDLMFGDARAFVDGLGGDFEINSPSTVNIFFLPRFGGANGISLIGTTTAFVIDNPSVHDRRVTSHEIGHMLGLNHVGDSGRLMASGTNGMVLSNTEIATARSKAGEILAGVR